MLGVTKEKDMGYLPGNPPLAKLSVQCLSQGIRNEMFKSQG